jgi:hypothetical protein
MNQITLRGFNRDRKILAIKTIRALTGIVLSAKLGLKESKAVIDDLESGSVVTLIVQPEHESAIRMLLDAGEIVHRDTAVNTRCIEDYAPEPNYDPPWGYYADEQPDEICPDDIPEVSSDEIPF